MNAVVVHMYTVRGLLHKDRNIYRLRDVANRQYTMREKRLLSEWLALRYPRDRVIIEQRLGPSVPSPIAVPPRSDIQGLLNNYRRFADALVIRSHELLLIEAKIIATPGIVSTLELYRDLLPLTPELTAYKNFKLRAVLVWAVNDPVLAAIAKRHGIEVEIFTPAWVVEDLRAKYGDSLRMTSPSYTPSELAK